MFNIANYKDKYKPVSVKAYDPANYLVGIGDLNPIFVSDCLVHVPNDIDFILAVNNEQTSDGQLLNQIKDTGKRIYARIPLNDPCSDKDFRNFQEAVTWALGAARTNNKVLIHCAAGINRSPSVACTAYAILKKITIQEAVNLLSQTRTVHPDRDYLLMGQYLNQEI